MSENSIKILIVEDEMLIGAKISMFLSELGYEVTGILPRAEEALLHAAENLPDIALLDIRLKGTMSGIDLAIALQKTHAIPVIFLTANSDDATFAEAKAARPYAFLTKPFKKLDLQRAIELTISRIADTDTGQPPAKIEESTSYILSDRIFVRHKEKMVKILFDTILYIEAERSYCKVFTQSKEYLLTLPMKNLEDKLPPENFQRIHRSFIVNLTQIDEVDENTVVVAKKNLPLSKSFRDTFLLRIKTI
jgi:DNA-binding LytR/AlgR family response regulator